MILSKNLEASDKSFSYGQSIIHDIIEDGGTYQEARDHLIEEKNFSPDTIDRMIETVQNTRRNIVEEGEEESQPSQKEEKSEEKSEEESEEKSEEKEAQFMGNNEIMEPHGRVDSDQTNIFHNYDVIAEDKYIQILKDRESGKLYLSQKQGDKLNVGPITNEMAVLHFPELHDELIDDYNYTPTKEERIAEKHREDFYQMSDEDEIKNAFRWMLNKTSIYVSSNIIEQKMNKLGQLFDSEDTYDKDPFGDLIEDDDLSEKNFKAGDIVIRQSDNKAFVVVDCSGSNCVATDAIPTIDGKYKYSTVRIYDLNEAPSDFVFSEDEDNITDAIYQYYSLEEDLEEPYFPESFEEASERGFVHDYTEEDWNAYERGGKNISSLTKKAQSPSPWEPGSDVTTRPNYNDWFNWSWEAIIDHSRRGKKIEDLRDTPLDTRLWNQHKEDPELLLEDQLFEGRDVVDKIHYNEDGYWDPITNSASIEGRMVELGLNDNPETWKGNIPQIEKRRR